MRSPEGLIAFFASGVLTGVIIAFVDVGKLGKRPLLGGAFVVVFGALCAFMSWTLRDQLDATELALWLGGVCVFVIALTAFAKTRP